MNNLTKFDTQAQYEAAQATLGYPNVSWITSGNSLHYVRFNPTPPTPTGQTPTFAVVTNIQTYTATTYCKVYDMETSKWYMLNNLNQYEEYGIYDITGSSLSDYTYYEGKLVAVGTTEYQRSGDTWATVGTYEDTEVTYAIDRTDQYKYSGQTISTTFKILMSELGSLTVTIYDGNSKQHPLLNQFW